MNFLFAFLVYILSLSSLKMNSIYNLTFDNHKFDCSNGAGNIILYAEAIRPGLYTEGLPYIYISISNHNLKGYLGYDAYKGSGYEGCWYFNLPKINDSLYQGFVCPTLIHFERKDFILISIFKKDNKWYYKKGKDKHSILFSNYDYTETNELIRKEIFINAYFNVQSFYLDKQSKKLYNNNRDSLLKSFFFKLPFTQFENEISKLNIDELSDLLQIHKLYKQSKNDFIFKKIGNNTKECFIIDEERVFKLFRLVHPIPPPVSFTPEYYIQRKKYNNNLDNSIPKKEFDLIDFYIGHDILKVENYWFQFNKNSEEKIQSLCD